MTETDVFLVGAGPIGLELAASLRRGGVEYLHIEAGQVGQTVMSYPHQAQFFSSPSRIAIAGVPLHTPDQTKATREQYLAYLRAVVEQYNLPIRTYERLIGVKRDPATGRFFLRTRHGGDEYAYSARCVVLAIGDMHAPRMLHIPGEDLPHVTHYFVEPHPFFRQRLLIVGGRNSAVEAAIRCHRAGAQVTLAYRRADFDRKAIKYWLLPELDALIKHGQITFLPQTIPTSITKTHATLSAVDEHCHVLPQTTRRLEAHAVLLLTGYVQDTTLFELAGVTLVGPNRAPQIDPDTMQSDVPNLFVAGTAAAGTQLSFRLFIENCHVHVTRIFRAITGRDPDRALINDAGQTYGLPES